MEDIYRSQFRLPYSLYESLKAAADQNHRSLNAELVARLEASISDDVVAFLRPDLRERLAKTAAFNKLPTPDQVAQLIDAAYWYLEDIYTAELDYPENFEASIEPSSAPSEGHDVADAIVYASLHNRLNSLESNVEKQLQQIVELLKK